MPYKPVIPFTHPYTPELLPVVQHTIKGWLGKSDTVFEYGSGHSTLWLAGLSNEVISVEHDNNWFMAVKDELARSSLQAKVLLAKPTELADSIDGWGQFDLIIVDCYDRCRVDAVAASKPHVKFGGYLVLDDSHWPMLKDAHKYLADWNRTDVIGMHKRKTGETRRHVTSFYQRPVNG